VRLRDFAAGLFHDANVVDFVPGIDRSDRPQKGDERDG
jgi:hypothetical protein